MQGWDHEWYDARLSAVVPYEQHLKDELEHLGQLTDMLKESQAKFNATFNFLEGFMPTSSSTVDSYQNKSGSTKHGSLPDGGEYQSFAASCKKALEGAWDELVGEDREEFTDLAYLSHPEDWVFASSEPEEE